MALRCKAGARTSSRSLAHRPVPAAGSLLRCRNRLPGSVPTRGVTLRQLPKESQLVTRARDGATDDFDAILAKLADRFEKAENKPIIVAYTFGAFIALIGAEWFIHLPLFNVILGGPIQLLGLFVIPLLGVRYFVENKDFYKDVEESAGKVIDVLPGLKK